MTEVTGVTTVQIDQAGDDYAYLLEQALDRVTRTVARRWSPTATEDDLGAIRALWLEQVDQALAPTLALLLHTGAAGIRSQLRDALTAAAVRMADIPPVPHHLTDAYLATAANRLQGAGDLLWEAARDQLREGVAAGESHAKLARRIRKATDLALPRARVLARTEARDALLAGSLNQVRATGLTGTKTWVSVRRSPRTRPEHKHAHGQTVDLRGFFEVGGWPMDRPHDDTAPAELTISCRCGLKYSLDTADVLLGPAPERAPADDRLLRQVWAGGMVRAGVTVEQLAEVLADLGLTAAGEAFHLPGKHDQHTHGHGGSGWRPSMSADDAASWAEGSAISETLYHGSDAADTIRENGFSLEHTGTRTFNGGVMGAGHYLTELEGEAGEYAGRGKILKTRVNVKRPVDMDDRDFARSEVVMKTLFRREKGKDVDSWIDEPSGFGKESRRDLVGMSPAEVQAKYGGLAADHGKFWHGHAQSHFLQDLGYDGAVWREGGKIKELNVFDDHGIVVIDE